MCLVLTIKLHIKISEYIMYFTYIGWSSLHQKWWQQIWSIYRYPWVQTWRFASQNPRQRCQHSRKTWRKNRWKQQQKLCFSTFSKEFHLASRMQNGDGFFQPFQGWSFDCICSQNWSWIFFFFPKNSYWNRKFRRRKWKWNQDHPRT